jgi:hypothetical protein
MINTMRLSDELRQGVADLLLEHVYSCELWASKTPRAKDEGDRNLALNYLEDLKLRLERGDLP